MWLSRISKGDKIVVAFLCSSTLKSGEIGWLGWLCGEGDNRVDDVIAWSHENTMPDVSSTRTSLEPFLNIYDIPVASAANHIRTKRCSYTGSTNTARAEHSPKGSE